MEIDIKSCSVKQENRVDRINFYISDASQLESRKKVSGGVKIRSERSKNSGKI